MADTTRGVTVVHRQTCTSSQGGRCNCKPGHRAEAYDSVTGRRKYRTFPDPRSAEIWRKDQQSKLHAGTTRAVKAVSVMTAYEAWSAAALAGTARNRSGERYKPSVLDSYAGLYRLHVNGLGAAKVGEVRTVHVQQLVDRLVAKGSAAQTVRNVVTVLRVVFKYAIRQEWVAVNPCVDLHLPAGGSVRDRIASPSEAMLLINALPRVDDRALWATAFFAGLRRGELMGLRWPDVALADSEIHVRQAYDPRTKTYVLPKSKAGTRLLGFPDVLTGYLAALDGTEGLVFEADKGGPFSDKTVVPRALRAWKVAKLTPIGLHEARHTYASLMIAAGVNIKAISEYMGHSSVTITLDRYGHLLPGAAKEAMGLLNAYLEKELSS